MLARWPFLCAIIVALVGIWSTINPYDRFTWWLESVPAIVAMVLLIATYKKFPLTPLLYGLIAAHCIVLFVGGHYTYARVPLFDDCKTWFDWTRNHYDRVGHVMQGLVPAMVIRELLLRTSPLRSGKWLFAIIVFGCLGISAAYEIIEWLTSVLTGEAADSFLGTQGDVWDTQNDMLCAAIGAVAGLLLLSSWHNKQLKRIQQSTADF